MKQALSSLTKLNILTEGIRFIIGGLTTTCLLWVCCIALIEVFNIHYLIANNIATLTAWGYAYFINKHLVFKNREKKHVEHGSKFIALQASLLALTNLNLFILVEVMGLHYLLSLIANAIAMTLLNFALLKLIVFKHNQE